MPCPSFWREVGYLPVGRMGQPGEDVVQIGIRIDSATTAAFHDGVQDGATFPGVGFADK